MRKITITFGILFVLLLIIFGLAILNLNFFINSNKEYFLSQIEQSIGRKITVGEINTGFKEGLGIRLKNFSLEDDRTYSDGNFILARDIQINVEFIPLLAKKININKLILDKPIINVIKKKNGKFNFESIGLSQKDVNNNRESKDKSKPKALPIFASSIIINDGQINYFEEINETEFQIQKINLRLKDLGFDKKVPVKLKAAVLANEPNVILNGEFGPVNSDFDFSALPLVGRAEIFDLNISTLKKFFPIIKEKMPKGLDISGPISAELNFSGRTDSLKLSGIDIKASVFGASVPNLKLSGDLGPIGKNAENFSIDADFSLQNANLSKLRKFSLIKGSIPHSLSTQGTLDFKGQITGTSDDLNFKNARIDVTRSRLAVIGKFFKPKDAPFVITAEGKISEKLVELRRSDIKLNSLQIRTSGKIHRGTTNLMNLTLTSNKVDLSKMAETFPALKEYKPGGSIELTPTKITGEMGKGQIPQINGALRVDNLRINPPSIPEPIKNINTKVTFTGESAEIKNMTLRIGDSDIRLSSEINKFSPLEITYILTSPELRISDIKKDKSKNKQDEVIKELKSEGKILKKHDSLMLNGTLSSSEAILSDFKMYDLKTKFNLVNEIFKIDDFSLRAYDGTIKGKGGVGIGSDSDFSLITNVRGLNLKKFLSSRNSKNSQKIEGLANLDINIFGSGEKWETIKTTLKGTAKAEIIDGAVLDINLADEVIEGLTGVPGLTFLISPQTKEKYPQVFTAQDTKFDEFKSSFIIEKGKMDTKDLRITSKDYLITGRGWMNLDGKINLKSLLVLSQEFSEDLESDVPDIRYITNQENRVEIPFAISGTIPKAKPKPDISYMAKLVQRAGIRKVLDSIASGDEPVEENNEAQSDPAPKKKKRFDEKIIDEIKDLF